MRTIGTDRWHVRVDETEANGEGRVHITYRKTNNSLAPTFDGAQELLGLLGAILPIEEYAEPPPVTVTEPT